MKTKIINKFTIILLICLVSGYSLGAQGDNRVIDRWLVLGPGSVPGNTENHILSSRHIQVEQLEPIAGDKVMWSKNSTLTWRTLKNFSFTSKAVSVLHMAVYLESFRWLKGTIKLDTGGEDVEAALFFDGKPLTSTRSGNFLEAAVELLNQKHTLVVKILLPAGKTIKIAGNLFIPDTFNGARVDISTVPDHRITEANILNTVDVKGITVSPDGKLAALSLDRALEGTGEMEKWVEIISTQTGKTIFSSRGIGNPTNIKWLKDSQSFSYLQYKGDTSSIYIYRLDNFTHKPVLEGVKDLSDYWWAPDNSFLVYGISQGDNNKKGYKFIKEITDRPKYSGTRSSMYIYFPQGGITHMVSKKESNFDQAISSPDSKTILFTGNKVDNKNRPYYINYAYTFDVKTFESKKLIESNWVNTFVWSPDSRKILMLGGPSAFAGLGKSLGEDVIPNDYDVQAYIYNLNEPEKPLPISKKFDPSIKLASWDWSQENIFFTTTDKSNSSLYKYSVSRNNYIKINTPEDSVGGIGFAERAGTAVFWGSGANSPYKLYRVDLARSKVSLLRDYNKDIFERVKIGKVQPWDFKTQEGRTISGRIHYPVDFNPREKYPCIVYYYGGTSPVGRSFGGRYPFNWYTAKGYIVYVLQPSGAIGFGQDFSASHVNDWGEITSQEVILGVKKLLAAHPYIDPQALGAMGASYGGFLTQYIATRTDIFAAFISHAGISDLTSYWGEGDWGYTYSGIATAGSFPWNRKDIYVGHSPLFMADRISAPMLLLHGSVDNNVPPGESYQMFAALKLLGKDVALVTFDGQYHFVLDYPKRIQWMRTIIAWWDKHLKKQPQYWQRLYPEESKKD